MLFELLTYRVKKKKGGGRTDTGGEIFVRVEVKYERVILGRALKNC